ncbi:MAG: RidA family protein [candidate division WOR-3 bacterium]|uniref:RidA family protein n=1 Tax=candidate division WOR-3 bacterium TaxID=2052148 RepID=A0A7C3IUX1_UNCW3|nr:RidA family protein [candidate division WOR-3 bacterium]
MKKSISSEKAPKPVGPYSPAVIAGEFVWTSGQLGIDPATGELVPGGIEAETEQALKNLAAVLEAAGSGLDRVIKTLIFITDMSQFAKVNAVYARYFQEPYPARSTVQVSALPKGAMVEIEAVALR